MLNTSYTKMKMMKGVCLYLYRLKYKYKNKNRQSVFVLLTFFFALLLLLLGPPVAKLILCEERLASLMKSEAGLPMDDIEVDYHQLLTSSECDYTEGRWVRDEAGPLYSGEECSKSPWLMEMWACRLTSRPSFDYENYRWQPYNCDLPSFDARFFLNRLQNKTVAFLGDSLGRQQFQSLMCLITRGKNDTFDVEDVSAEYGFMQRPRTMRPDGWSYRFLLTNTTLLFYWSATLADIRPINSSINMAMHVDCPPSFLLRNLPRFHVIVLNSGHHWTQRKFKKNRWKMHIAGKRLPNSHLFLRSPLSVAYNFTLHSSLRWLDQSLDQQQQAAFLQTLSPRHFFHGDWDSGGRCDNTRLKAGRRVLRGPLLDDIAESAVRGTRVRLLNITYLSQYRDEAHISQYNPKFKNGSQDCLHWCLPGVPDTWNQILYAQILNQPSLCKG